MTSFFSRRFLMTGAFNQNEIHLKITFFPSSIKAETEFRTNGYFRICQHFSRQAKTWEIVHSIAQKTQRSILKTHEPSELVL